jgi:hypothetical protein
MVEARKATLTTQNSLKLAFSSLYRRTKGDQLLLVPFAVRVYVPRC